MIVSLVIFPYGPLAEVADQGVSGHFKLSQTQTSSFDFETLEHRRFDIRNEIGLPDVDQTAHVALLAGFEIIVFAIEAIRKTIGTVENKIFIPIDVERERRVGHGQKTHR